MAKIFTNFLEMYQTFPVFYKHNIKHKTHFCGTIIKTKKMSFKIDHVAIVTKSFEKLTSWYINNLGFKITNQWTLDVLLPGKRLAYLEKDGVKLEIIGNGTMVAEAVYGQNIIEDYMIPGYRHYCISVQDVDAITNDLMGKGVNIVFPATDFSNLGVRASIVTDCDGNTIEFMAPLK